MRRIYDLVLNRDNTRFLCGQAEFRNWAKGKKQLRLEFFYREMRKKHKILLDVANKPIGGKMLLAEINLKLIEQGYDL